MKIPDDLGNLIDSDHMNLTRQKWSELRALTRGNFSKYVDTKGNIVDAIKKRTNVDQKPIMGKARTILIAKLLGHTKAPFVVPYDQNPIFKVRRTRRINGLLKKFWVDQKMTQKMVTVIKNEFCTGGGLIHVFKTHKSDPFSNLVSDTEYDSEGEVKVESIRTDDAFFDVGTDEFEEQNYFIWRFRVKESLLKRMFKIKQDDMDQDFAPMNLPEFYDHTIDQQFQMEREAGDKERFVWIFQGYVKPSKDHPKGIHFIALRSRVLWSEDWSAPIPVYLYAPGAEQGMLLGVPKAALIKSMQTEANTAASRIAENFRDAACVKWMRHTGSSVNIRHLNNENGIVDYDGVAPNRDSYQGMDSGLLRRPEEMEARALSAVGISQPGAANISGIKSGQPTSLIDLILREEGANLYTDVVCLNQFVSQLVLCVLRLMKELYNVGRKVPAIFGDDEFLMLDISEIDFDDNYEVKVEMGVDVGPGDAYNQRTFENLLQNQLITFDQFIVAQKNSWSFSSLEQEFNADAEKAERNLEKIVSGMAFDSRDVDSMSASIDDLLNEFDDLNTHKRIFVQYVKTVHFEIQSDEVKAAIRSYLMYIDEMMQEIAMKQMQAQAMTNQMGLSEPETLQLQENRVTAMGNSPGHPVMGADAEQGVNDV